MNNERDYYDNKEKERNYYDNEELADICKKAGLNAIDALNTNNFNKFKENINTLKQKDCIRYDIRHRDLLDNMIKISSEDFKNIMKTKKIAPKDPSRPPQFYIDYLKDANVFHDEKNKRVSSSEIRSVLPAPGFTFYPDVPEYEKTLRDLIALNYEIRNNIHEDMDNDKKFIEDAKNVSIRDLGKLANVGSKNRDTGIYTPHIIQEITKAMKGYNITEEDPNTPKASKPGKRKRESWINIGGKKWRLN